MCTGTRNGTVSDAMWAQSITVYFHIMDLFFCGCLVPEIKARFYLATFAPEVFTIYLEHESVDWQKDLEEQF